jgi:DNA-directed RNA polymerase subunit RPC12/RpoP
MDYYDPPFDPYGDEVRCPLCDHLMEYNSWVREWECNHHEYMTIICTECEFFEFDGETSEADADWTIACPQCGGATKVSEYNLEDL